MYFSPYMSWWSCPFEGYYTLNGYATANYNNPHPGVSNMSMSTKDRHDFLQPVAVSMYHKYRTNCYRNYLSKWLSAVVRFTLGVAEELNFLHAQLLQGNPSSDHLGQYDYPQSSRSWYNHCNSPMVYSLWFSCRERWCLRHWLADISTR